MPVGGRGTGREVEEAGRAVRPQRRADLAEEEPGGRKIRQEEPQAGVQSKQGFTKLMASH